MRSKRLVQLFCMSWLSATLALGSARSAESRDRADENTGATVPAISFLEINPDQSSSTDPDAASGGRVNALASLDGKTIYAASEWGGLFESIDSGASWTHVDGHSPSATWRVQVDPTDANHLYATSLYDGRTSSLAGLNVSADGGVTWTHPAIAAPNSLHCLDSDRTLESAALGIAIDPANPNRVYVGTTCGIVITSDRGASWRRVDPSPADPADTVWDIVVHHGGVVDACGDDGHVRSTNAGMTWTIDSTLPSGRCSIAASPAEADVVFAFVGKIIYESDDGGKNWVGSPDPNYQGRIPFIKTNKRAGSAFDLWFGDVVLYRASCASATGMQRCGNPIQFTELGTRSAGAHDDVGDLLFLGNGTDESCPILFSSDGGIYLNTNHSSPACQTPAWVQPQVSPHALWVFSFDAATDNQTNKTSLYFADQDTGTFVASDGLATPPTWINIECCDGFDIIASPDRVMYSTCCFVGGRANLVFVASPGAQNPTEISPYPAGQITGWKHSRSFQQFAANSYVMITDGGVFTVPDVNSSPLQWMPLDQATSPSQVCGIQVSVPAGSPPVFFVQTENCDGVNPARLFQHNGATDGAGWSEISKPYPDGGFGLVAVNRSNSRQIIASYIRSTSDEVHMLMTEDGGAHWQTLADLDSLMTQNGIFRYRTHTGPTDFESFGGYVQPTLVSFDSTDSRFVVAGGADSGIFLSDDSGHSWRLISDQVTPSRHGGFVIPRPRMASFRGDGNTLTLFVASQGRGMWKVVIDTSAWKGQVGASLISPAPKKKP